MELSSPTDTSTIGHIHSPLFTILPAELRLQIYEAIFEGSQANIFLWSVEETEYRSLYHYKLRPTPHNLLLFVCRGIYNEALTVYWSQTTIDLGGSKLPHRWSCLMLDAIPIYARPYIRYITGVAHIRESRHWYFTLFLQQFPALRICFFEEDVVIEESPSDTLWWSKQSHYDNCGAAMSALKSVRMCKDTWDTPQIHWATREPIPFPEGIIVLQRLHAVYFRIPDNTIVVLVSYTSYQQLKLVDILYRV